MEGIEYYNAEKSMTIFTLPSEIQRLIFSFLKKDDLVRVRSTCKSFFRIVEDLLTLSVRVYRDRDGNNIVKSVDLKNWLAKWNTSVLEKFTKLYFSADIALLIEVLPYFPKLNRLLIYGEGVFSTFSMV